MIKKLKDLISNFSEKNEATDFQDISNLDNACAALLIEIAFADKDLIKVSKTLLKSH